MENPKRSSSIFNRGHGLLLYPFVLNSSGGFAAAKNIFFSVSSDHRSQCHLKLQSCLTTAFCLVLVFFFFFYEVGYFFLKPSRTTQGDVGDV